MAQWLRVFGTKDMDALSLKGREAAHIQRLGGARMMRVPNTAGKPFLEKLSTYQRALQRQLAGEAYDLVWCADLFSAAAVAPMLKGAASLLIEITEVPSQSRLLTGDDVELKKRWRDGERAAVRAATKVFLPSRHAVKLMSERIDARLVQVIPRCIDRTVFSPPSVEIALDDERLVLIFGGREGGPRLKAAAALAHALAAVLPRSVRIGILGPSSPADVDLNAVLGKLGLRGRVELVDADESRAVTGALSLAHVVVVPSSAEDDREPFALPHRALEAMACGRAVVVSGPDAAFRDGATPGEHFVAAPARDPRRVAKAVEDLLGDPLTRASLSRAAARHVEATADLMSRALEVQQIVVDATGVRLKLHPPRGDDPDTSSKSAPQPPSPTAVAAPPPVVSSRSGPSPPGPANGGRESTALATSQGTESKPSSSGDSVFAPASMLPMPTLRTELPELGSASASLLESGAMWDGDTYLDGGHVHAPLAIETSPDAARVREAMLVSSDAQSKADASVPLASSVSSLRSQSGGAVPTSLMIGDALEERPRAGDPWGPDTIADGTPLSPLDERGRADHSVFAKASPKRSLLVDAGADKKADPKDKTLAKTVVAVASEAADMTMEDQPLTSSQESSDE